MIDESATEDSGDRFPKTRWSAILAARSDDESERARALDVLIAAYWKPVYKYVRVKWGKPVEDAKDLTQGFFAKAIEKDFFHGYDPSRARFRTFLRTCIDGFVANEQKASRRIKRGGAVSVESLDFASAEGELSLADIPSPDTLDDYFEKEWARSFLSLAVDSLSESLNAGNREIHFRLFERYYLANDAAGPEPSYNSLAH
jgi:RNA polymerase sigma factor (sigma-70 family)